MTVSLYEKEREYKDRISKKFNVVINYYFEDYFCQNPEEASFLGLTLYDSKIKDFSNFAFEKELETNKTVQKKLKMINPYNLNVDEHIDYLLLKSRVDQFLFDHEQSINHRAIKPLLYMPTKSIYTLLQRTMKDTDRLKSITSRLLQSPHLIKQAIENLKCPPRIWTEMAIKRIKPIKEFFKSLPEIDIIKNAAKEHPDLGNQLVEANNNWLAALEEYDRYLNVELIEHSQGEFCIGRQAFDFYLQNNLFLSYSSGYLNELGYELFNKTESDMKTLALTIDKNKSLEQVLSELETNYSKTDKLHETYSQLVKRTQAFVKDSDIITFPEKEEVKIINTPAYLRDIIPYAAYFTLGPYEPSNVGQFWITPVDETDPEKSRQILMDSHNLHKLPAIVLHETYPGHHLNLMIAKKVLFEKGATTIRRATYSNLFVEGWATYCEQMMGELGFYSDQQKLFTLKNRLWRAARVILDTELHTGRKSYDEAVLFLIQKLNMCPDAAKAEITRYTMMPTQPLSYEIGRRLINQLRDKEKIRLKENFSLKQFHDKLLSKGNLPIKLLEELAFQNKVEVLQ